MPHQFIGHINLHWLSPAWAPAPGGYEAKAKEFVESVGCSDAVVVLEYGSVEGHPHFHYWLETAKAKNTVIAKVKSVFSEVGRVPPAQWFSCKVANPAKLPEYFQYLAKGPHSVEDEAPCVMVDLSCSRMWGELHESFHKKAKEIVASRAGVKETFYEMLAGRCREKGATSKDGVLEVVTRYYVEESKKGFDKFSVTRVFWAVYALVNSGACHDALLEQCKRMVDV